MKTQPLKLLARCLLCAALIGALQAEPTALNSPRAFTNQKNQTLMATVVSIDLNTVTLKRASDNKVFTLQISELSVTDQVFLAENRAALGKVSGALKPLETRTVTGTEVAKAKRFAKDVLMTTFYGRTTDIKKLASRPKLTVLSSDPELAAYTEKIFGDFCDAAGLIESASKSPEVTFGIGTKAELEIWRKKLLPDDPDYWWWRSEWNHTKREYDYFILFAPNIVPNERNNQIHILREFSNLFGCNGTSTEFEPSAFHAEVRSTELEPIDRQLIRLLYTKVPEKSSRDQLFKIIQENWASLVAPPKSLAKP